MKSPRPVIALHASILVIAACQNAAAAEAPRGVLGAAPPAGADMLTPTAGEHGFVGMTGAPLDWRYEAGVLTSTANGRRSNHAISRRPYRDCLVHVEFRQPQSTDGNSGAYLQGLYEIQILKADPDASLGQGDLGAIYGVRPPDTNAALPAGEWNALDVRFFAPRRGSDGEIVTPGSLSAWLNGFQLHDAVPLDEPNSRYNPYRYDTTPYLQRIWRDYPHTESGPLVLQDHDSPVEFRNVWVRPLEDSESSAQDE